jgi:hypothetical protein
LFVQLIINMVCVEARVLLMIMGGPHPREELTRELHCCYTVVTLLLYCCYTYARAQ